MAQSVGKLDGSIARSFGFEIAFFLVESRC